MSEDLADKVAQPESGLFQYCLEPGCAFTAKWQGGSASEDPSLPHLFINPEHTVRSGAHLGHLRLMKMQQQGKKDVTQDVDPDEWRGQDV